MARPKQIPQLRWFPQRGCWRAYFNGRTRYYRGTEAEARLSFDSDVRDWMADGAKPANPGRIDTVGSTMTKVLEHLKEAGEYGGRPEHYGHSQFNNHRATVRLLKLPVGGRPVESLPIHRLDAPAVAGWRDAMVTAEKSRGYVNSSLNRLKHLMRKARELGLIGPEQVADISTVSAVRAGHRGVKDPPKRQPIPDADVAILLTAPDGLCKTPTCRAVVQVLHATGMRVGECLRMRVSNLVPDDDVWWLELGTDHKTGHRGTIKRVAIGPRAQAAIEPYLLMAKQRPGGSDHVWPASQNGGVEAMKPHYVQETLKAACRRLKLPSYTPHQLRHTKATAEFTRAALEAVAAVAGQDSLSTASRYSKRDLAAAEIARKFG